MFTRVAQGDPAAFEALYDRTAPHVFGLVNAILADTAAAERVTMDVYQELWRIAPRLNPAEGDATTWLLTRAHRHAVEHRRSLRAKTAAHNGGPQPRPACLDQLDALSGQLLLLTYFRGHTCRDTAALLGLPAETAQAGLLTALRELDRTPAQPVTARRT